MQAVLSLPFLAVTHGGFKPKHLVRADAACPRGSGMSKAVWSRAELQGLEGVNPCSSLQADPDPRGWGIWQNPGSSPARRGVGAHQRMGGTAFAHPQCHIPQRHSPGWSPLCSARICCTGQRGQRQKALGQGRTPPWSPGPFLNPPAPTQLLHSSPAGQPQPRALRYREPKAACTRCSGTPQAPAAPPDPQPLPVGAACSTLTLGRAGWA